MAIEIAAPMKDDELPAVNDALERLSQHAPQKAELVKLRYFAGLWDCSHAQNSSASLLRRAAGLKSSSSGLSAWRGNGIARRLTICL